MNEASSPIFAVIPPECLGLSASLPVWPSLVTSYAYVGDAAAANLQIDLALDASAYPPPLQEGVTPRDVGADLSAYTTIQSQLALRYDALGNADLTGYVFDVQVTETLFGSVPMSLPDADAAIVRGFVDACVEYLRALASGSVPSVIPRTRLTLRRVPSEAVDDDVVPLVTALWMRCRPLALGLPGLRVDGPAIRIDLPAATDAPGRSEVTWFAESLENVFTASDSARHVGVDVGEGGASSLWAIRVARAQRGKGIDFALVDEGGYFAAKPVARAPLAGTVLLPSYSPTEGISSAVTPTVFAGIDLNTWTASALNSIDAFLAPDSLRAMQAVVEEPAAGGVFAKIESDRAALTAAIEGTTWPILATSSLDGATRIAARECLHDAVAQASESCTTATVGVFVAHVAPWKAAQVSSVHPPRLHGRIAYGDADGAGGAVSMGAAVVPLAGAAGGDTRVAFAFRPQAVTEASEIAEVLRFEAASVECSIVDAENRTERTARIAFVTSPTAWTVANGAVVHVPIPLRELPVPVSGSRGDRSTVVSSIFSARGDLVPRSATTPEEFPYWCCRITAEGTLSAQDAVRVVMGENDSSRAEGAADSSMSLFAAAAQFVHLFPKIVTALDSAIHPEEEGAKPTEEQVQIATTAVKAFERILDEFVQAYRGVAAQSGSTSQSGGAPETDASFDIRLRGSTEFVTRSGARAAQIDFLSTGPSMPTPADSYVEIGNDVTPQRLSTSPPSFVFRRLSPQGDFVSYDEFRSAPRRFINLQMFDACVVSSIRSGMYVRRNAYLVPGAATSSAFCFDSMKVEAPAAISPSLLYGDFPLATLGGGPLTELLGTFFAQLLAGAVNTEVLVEVQCDFNKEIAPGVHATTPVLTLPRTVASAANHLFTAPLCEQIRLWRESTQPGEGWFQFAVKLFARNADAEAEPLVGVENVFVDAAVPIQ